VISDPDLAAVAGLMGDRSRAAFLLELMSGDELPATELAARAGVSSPLASAHLSRLLDGGLVSARRDGRQRLYRISQPEVAEAIEGLVRIAPERHARTLRESHRGQAIQRARTCYDHLAGRLGVELTAALERDRVIVAGDGGYRLTAAGERRLESLGLDLGAVRARRRAFARQCIDWTERRPHLAGALGAALADRLFEMGWVRRVPATRAVQVTPAGEDGLWAEFGLDRAA
jgi:DNA-binding transcriptional ArsR family regulator